jgi:hypothetical protein
MIGSVTQLSSEGRLHQLSRGALLVDCSLSHRALHGPTCSGSAPG